MYRHVLLGVSLSLLDLQHWLNHLGTTVTQITTRQHKEKHTVLIKYYTMLEKLSTDFQFSIQKIGTGVYNVLLSTGLI